MWKCTARIIGLTSLSALFGLFSGCTSYYLQKVNTSFCAPNGSPNAVVKRDAGDTRLSVGLSVNPKSELKFNDGNHSNIRISDSYLYDEKYQGENIEVNFPQIQGSLLLDYSILKHLFVFGKGNFGYADDKYSVAINAGVGAHFGVSKISISGYLMPGFMGGIDNDNELIADEIFPTITFAYSYCFKRKK
jgi:hypothetical protein